MQNDIPRIKKAVLTQKLNIAVDESTKSDYDTLKSRHGIDVAECVRSAVRREIKRLKAIVAEENQSA
jgi:hypothetical protein